MSRGRCGKECLRRRFARETRRGPRECAPNLTASSLVIATRMLHHTGEVLFVEQGRFGSKWVVLDPHWLCSRLLGRLTVLPSDIPPGPRAAAKLMVEEEAAKFYVAGVFKALNYVHEAEVVCRACTLDAVMLDNKGYPQLVDFALSKSVSNGRTHTLCGVAEPPIFAVAPGMSGVERLKYDYQENGAATSRCCRTANRIPSRCRAHVLRWPFDVGHHARGAAVGAARLEEVGGAMQLVALHARVELGGRP